MKKILGFGTILLLLLVLASDAFGTAAAITVNSRTNVSLGNKKGVIMDISISAGTYTTGGVALTAQTCGITKIETLLTPSTHTGYNFVYDYTNSKIKLYHTTPTVTTTTLTIDDQNAAQAEGDTVYFATYDGVLGHFEAVVGENADTQVELTDGTYVAIYDNNAAATKGHPVYVCDGDTIATSSDRRLAYDSDAVNSVPTPSGVIYVPTSGGQCLAITGNADPATNYAASVLYTDPDVLLATLRFTTVALSNADVTVTTDDLVTAFTPAAPSIEVVNASTLTAVSNMIILVMGY